MEIFKPGKTSKEEEAHKEEIRYKGKLFEVVSEPVEIEGKMVQFEKVRRSPGVRLIMQDGQGNECFLLFGPINTGVMNINPNPDCSQFNYFCYSNDIKLFDCRYDANHENEWAANRPFLQRV